MFIEFICGRVCIFNYVSIFVLNVVCGRIGVTQAGLGICLNTSWRTQVSGSSGLFDMSPLSRQNIEAVEISPMMGTK